MFLGVRLYMDTQLISPVLLTLAVALIIGEFVQIGKRRRLERLRYRLGQVGTEARFGEPPPVVARRAYLRRVGVQLGRLTGRFVPQRIVAAYGMLLLRAGRDPHATLPLLITAKLSTSFLGAALAVLLFSGPVKLRPPVLLTGAVGLLLGYLAPDLWLQRQITRYAQRLRASIPPGIDVLSISLEGGLSIEAALARLCATVKDPFAHEMDIYLQLRSLGHGRRAALDQVVERTDVDELRVFTGTLAQGEELGIGIVSVLRDLAADLRTHHRQRVTAHVQTASLRMMLPIVTCIMPAIFIVLLGPAINTVLSSFR